MKETMTLESLVVDQLLGSDNQHVRGELRFTVSAGGKRFPGTATVKQVVGTRYEEKAMEVSAPQGYQGPAIDYSAMNRVVTQVCHGLIGSQGGAIRSVGSENTTIKARFALNHTFEIELADE